MPSPSGNDVPCGTDDRIKLLLCSDPHLGVEQIFKIGEQLFKAAQDIDYILCPGDFCNLTDEQRERPELEWACEGEMSAVISSLENVFAKVIYIPGNHDPSATYKPYPPVLTPYSRNIHAKVQRLAPDLVIVGAGGSPSSFKKNGEMVWRGWPYGDEFSGEDEMLQVLKGVLKAERAPLDVLDKKHDVLYDNDQLLLMTHTGPWDFKTTNDATDPSGEIIYAGSKAVRATLEDSEQQTRVVMNVHGHTHHCKGMDKIGSVPVINPGSSKFGDYALVTLERLQDGTDAPENMPWVVAETTFAAVDVEHLSSA